MTGTDHDPRLPGSLHTERGIGEPSGAAHVWEPTGAPPKSTGPDGAWANWAIFAGVVLLIAGFGRVLLGIVALFDASNVDPTETDPALPIGYTAWGWIHVVGGGLLLAAGGALMARKEWGRLVAIAFAVVTIVGSLAFLPTAPVWGAILIALNVVIVYALTTHHAESMG
jgi:hypothetical protein